MHGMSEGVGCTGTKQEAVHTMLSLFSVLKMEMGMSMKTIGCERGENADSRPHEFIVALNLFQLALSTIGLGS